MKITLLFFVLMLLVSMVSASTVIQLQDATTENLADIHYSDSGALYGIMIKWNIISVPDGVTIVDVTQCLYILNSFGMDNDIDIWRVDGGGCNNPNGQSWDESASAMDIDFMIDGCARNKTSKTLSNITTGNWACFDVMQQFNISYYVENEDNFSISFEDPDAVVGIVTTVNDFTGLTMGGTAGNEFAFAAREHGTVTFRPYLNITYKACNPPASGNYAVDCSDACNWIVDDDIPGNITMTGSGIVTLSANWTFTGTNQQVYINPGCELHITSGGFNT